MQDLEVRGIDGIFHRLKPVTIELRMDDDRPVAVAAKQRIVRRHHRRWRRAHVGPDEI
jgi:hypothetical protein